MPSNYGTDYKAKTLSSNEALALPLDQHFTKDQYLAIREQSKKKKHAIQSEVFGRTVVRKLEFVKDSKDCI